MEKTSREGQEQRDEIRRLQKEIERLKRALENRQSQMRREIEEEIGEKLLEMGEEEVFLKLCLHDLRRSTDPGMRVRDLAANLAKELEVMVSESKAPSEGEEAEGEEKERLQTELDKKLEEARRMVKMLQERIKYFDRIDRKLSAKLEIMDSRRLAKVAGAYLGGVLIFIGGVLVTAGLLLTLAHQEFPFIYSMFDVFFNFLLIFIGALMLISGFLHQT